MGWGSGENVSGRAIGYNIEAVCDFEGCAERIDRGLAYACGEQHDADYWYCADYFCPDHLHGHGCQQDYPEDDD